MSSTRGATDKPALRRAVLSRRAALGEEQRARAAAAALDALLPLVEGTPGGTVAAYLAVGTEPGTAGLLATLADRHVRVLLPVLLPDHDLDWASAADGVQPGPYGLLEPAGPRLGRDAVADCSLIVVPALAVDRAGHRLGRGGGSYDRALPRTHGLVVALLHDGESVVELPAEPHDAPVDALVTPSRGLVRLREREGESA